MGAEEPPALRQSSDPFCTIMIYALPPVPLPRESPATSITPVPATTVTGDQAVDLAPLGTGMEKVVPPVMRPIRVTSPCAESENVISMDPHCTRVGFGGSSRKKSGVVGVVERHEVSEEYATSVIKLVPPVPTPKLKVRLMSNHMQRHEPVESPITAVKLEPPGKARGGRVKDVELNC